MNKRKHTAIKSYSVLPVTDLDVTFLWREAAGVMSVMLDVMTVRQINLKSLLLYVLQTYQHFTNNNKLKTYYYT